MKILSTLLFLISTIAVAQTGNKADDEVKLMQLKEVDWPKAYREQDTVLLNRILADEFKMIDSEGRSYTKRDELDYIKKHKPTYLSFRFEIKRLEIFENNTAIVSGTGTIKNTDGEGPYTVTYQSSNVLIKRDGQWRAIASHTSGDKVTRGH